MAVHMSKWKMDRGIMIAEAYHGFICANAGVDASNAPGGMLAHGPRPVS